MDIGFVLTAYDRTDDLLAHLDILKYYPSTHQTIPIWMNKDAPESFQQEITQYENSQYVDGVSFTTGPLLGLVSGLRKAKELGLDYIVYRNGDDWLFNHTFVHNNFKRMDKDGLHVIAYNWLTYNTIYEFAMNELYIRVDKFMETIDEAETYIRHSNKKYLCELKMAKWMKRTLGRDLEGFYRLSEREFWPGVGYEIETLPEVLSGYDPGPKFWASLKYNSRFFNKKWQLIGSHNNIQRYKHFISIRDEIPYVNELEKEKHFSRWLKSIGGGWNMPTCNKTVDPIKLEKIKERNRKKPLMFKMLPKKMPKRLFKSS